MMQIVKTAQRVRKAVLEYLPKLKSEQHANLYAAKAKTRKFQGLANLEAFMDSNQILNYATSFKMSELSAELIIIKSSGLK